MTKDQIRDRITKLLPTPLSEENRKTVESCKRFFNKYHFLPDWMEEELQKIHEEASNGGIN